jgi:hypothetical protein
MSTLNRIVLLSGGIYVSQMTPSSKLKDLLTSIWPKQIEGVSLQRIGSLGDGGYLLTMPNKRYTACFSPGVSNNSTFEKQLLEQYSIASHLADGTVDAPVDFIAKSFTKKNIGIIDSDKTMRLETWIEKQLPTDALHPNLLLQMDIEGDEYSIILDTPSSTLIKFGQIVIEFHNLWAWGEPEYYKIAKAAIDKLLTHFIPIHMHPNNAAGLVNLGGINIPQALELTLINKQQLNADMQIIGLASLPHPLDRPNDSGRPDIRLPEYWRH